MYIDKDEIIIPKHLKNCKKCNKLMKIRNGKFGMFLYCENSLKCLQKTVSVEFKPNHPVLSPYYEILRGRMDLHDRFLEDEINGTES